MNLYEFEGKQLFEKSGIAIPHGFVIRRGDNVVSKYNEFDIVDVVVKAQVLSGKRGKNNAIRFCSSADEVQQATEELFAMDVRGQYVTAVWVEEKLNIAEEHYMSIVYDTTNKQPVFIYSHEGGMDIEDVMEENVIKIPLDIRDIEWNGGNNLWEDGLREIIKKLWQCFLEHDARIVEINPLVQTRDNKWVAVDAKIALDDDAFFRHGSTNSPQVTNWEEFEPRTMMGRLPTDREIAVKKIDEGEKYYQGTAGKYIEMDGDIACLFMGGGASIANMDALMRVGLKPANYTEYSGNPPREKVYELTKIVLSKPGLRGLWIVGVVSNFTNVEETFLGTIDALDELKPSFPIVIRRDGPFGEDGRKLMQDCAERNNLTMKIFGKEVGMGETAEVLAELVK